MKIHPLHIIFYGLFMCSLGFNILYHKENQKLIYQIQKLEAGPAKGLFFKQEKEKNTESDEELNERIREMLKEMARDRMV
jgi:hypothetical protein